MAEYFAEFLEGCAFTETDGCRAMDCAVSSRHLFRCDVSRPKPMTFKWSSYARSLTKNAMKGMLTGPITMLEWSFVRDEIPRKDTARQIALAMRDEVRDLEAIGMPIIQVDEPALREGLLVRRSDWAPYLEWAVKASKPATSGIKDATQIHTHMCYCQFEDILPSIAGLDADLISMESARSKMQLPQAFRFHGYPNEIGPGVFDIHTPRMPSSEEMGKLIERELNVLEPTRI